MIFLQTLDAGTAGIAGTLLAAMAAFLLVFVLVGVGLYVYMSLAFMAIGKKARLSIPGLAWIPGIGPLIITFQAAKMHWWPWLLLIGIVIPYIGFIALIVFAVFSVIWQWKTFEAVGKPGWWAILCLIPVVNLILYGIAAWSK
ncbi:hypothetical protein FJZ19_04265 [Candidatus Pacearchaeota archaeon]|nr:hypothetical protein [Candidatus Pacearchaeota archaeon]